MTDRYVTNGMPGSLPVNISSPSGGATIDTSTVDVTGTTTAGANVVAEGSGFLGGAAAIASTTADGSGSWTLTLPVSFGSSTITVTATKGGSTGYAQTSVSSSLVPGTPVFSTGDPSGDDNGPGTYVYPTSSNFTAGSFDLTGMQINQTDTDVFITFKFRTLVPTFGNAFGAQMLDVYVHNPAATTTSTAPAFPQRNYSIAPADAWSERVRCKASPRRSGSMRLATASVRLCSSPTTAAVLRRSSCRSRSSGRSARVDIHGRAHGSGRLQPRPGTCVRAHPAGLRVRRLQAGGDEPDLLG